MYKMLDLKYSELVSKINTAFEQCAQESDLMRLGFSAYLARLNYVKAVTP
jgi:TLD